ncbi:phosphatidylserine/phosphatidylglycerophosphate/cardiolipin synthase family protein [Variovorax sp. OV329]|uniref:phospholipase D-like domain-containing protein n=1 Tax=Variovorax sp. OV329 TaxID=1882825 RepID=UPI0008DF5821|nr:phospholipase D family protein [Variovorax sp. OV329]SFN11911.1 putative cardiolipin synthase [Variovorax sp. OV329]
MESLAFCRWLLPMLLAVLAGCAGLPQGVERAHSQAFADTDDTTLATVAAASLGPVEEGGTARSGLRLLPAGDHALEARIALVRMASRSVDAQYYQIADDSSGRQFLRELRDAGARGVRVRLLVDDLYAGGEDALLAGLAEQPNVEVRLFNPLPVRDGGVAARTLLSLHEFSRINRRMHNKLLVADNAFAVSGGRNVADAYFERSEPANFIDLDLLSAGPVVARMSAVFDSYWNSEQAYPVQSLAAPEAQGEPARLAFDRRVQAQAMAAPLPAGDLDDLGQLPLGAQLRLGRVEMALAPVRVVADSPDKVTGVAMEDGAVMQANLDFLQSASSEIFVASPYFVPGERGLLAMRNAAARVRVSVVTNSLGTTDEPLAHFGYARYRVALLDMGVNLYELMPPDAAVHESEDRGPSLGRLHAKVAVVDGRWLSIGSMNMDRRSAHSNTEMALIIDSPVLAAQASALLHAQRLPRSYQLRAGGAGRTRLQWVARDGDRQVVHATEPSLNWGRRMRLSVLSAVIDEELL